MSQPSLESKHLLLKSLSSKLVLRLISQFRYTKVKSKLRRKLGSQGQLTHPTGLKFPKLGKQCCIPEDGGDLMLCSRSPAAKGLGKVFGTDKKGTSLQTSPSKHLKPGESSIYDELTLEQALNHAFPALISKGFRSLHNSPFRH